MGWGKQWRQGPCGGGWTQSGKILQCVGVAHESLQRVGLGSRVLCVVAEGDLQR